MKILSLFIQSSHTLYFMGVILVLFITSCSNNNLNDLEQYVQKQRDKTPGKIAPLPEAKSFRFYAYNEAGLRNPFVSEDIDTPPPKVCQQVTRNKTTLETVPLDTLTLVGSLEQDGERWALVKDQDNIVHRIKQGDYIGENNGRIISITESEVVLQETVSNREIGCQKRQTILAIAGQ